MWVGKTVDNRVLTIVLFEEDLPIYRLITAFDAEAYYNRGNAYYNRQEFAQGIEDYSKTIDLQPEFAEAYYNRGETWLHLRE